MPPELDEHGNPVVEDSSSGSGAVGTGNDARIALLESIADQHERNVEDQFADVHDDETTTPFRAKPAEASEISDGDEPVVPPIGEVTPPDTPPAPEVKKFKIKVNGKDLELTEEELVARAQKVESADEYLRDAKARVAAPAPPAGPSAEEIQRRQDDDDKALARALQMGTEEEALAAVRKIREQASARPSVTPDDVSRAIDERLVFRDAITAFRTEYKDIADDPVLWGLATQRDEELMRSGDGRSYAERFTEIGDELRTWVKSKAPTPTTPVVEVPVVETLDDKKTKKAAASRTPTPASAKTTGAPADDDNEETTQDVIAKIAKSRGGPQWMRS